MITDPRVNNQIRVPQVRVIDEKGEQLGILPTFEAIKIARDKGLDLIEVSDKAVPPVCKITDYGKFLYQREKKAREHKSHRVEVKEVRLSYNIAKHDMEMKAARAQKFMEKGDRVKVQIVLRGREKAFAGLAKEKLGEFKNYFKIPINIDQPIIREPRGFSMLISKGK